MAGIDLATANARLTAYLAAEEAILSGAQSYTVTIAGGQRTFTKADLALIQQGIATWDSRVKKLTRGGRIRIREVIPR